MKALIHNSSFIIPVLLTRIKTSDGVALEGIAVLPKKPSGTALIWLHGLNSRFSAGQVLINELSTRCRMRGIAYFKFNTRGHDAASGGAANSKKLFGGGFEKFEECVYDIRAMVVYARKLGYKKIILAGHSTGANKALYYTVHTRDRRIKNLILIAPVNDRSGASREHGPQWVKEGLRIAQTLKKKHTPLVPIRYGVMSPDRFISLYSAGGAEDVFPYDRADARWEALGKIRVSLAVIVAERDEYLDRPAREIIAAFERHARWTKSFSGIIIKGANHGFRKKEKELTEAIVGEINGL